MTAPGPWVYSARNGNEYQKQNKLRFLGVERDRCVANTNVGEIIIIMNALGPWVYSARNRNEYQKQNKLCFLGVERGRCVANTNVGDIIIIVIIIIIIMNALGPWVYSACNRNEYQKQNKFCFLGVERGRCVANTNVGDVIIIIMNAPDPWVYSARNRNELNMNHECYTIKRDIRYRINADTTSPSTLRKIYHRPF
jgi:hypothetical protein